MLNIYLEKLQETSPDESLFPMDSPHTGKKVLRKVVYGEKTDTTESRNRIMIDFDGVIHKYTEWNNGTLNKEMIPGTKEAIDKLRHKYEIVIFTTRASATYKSPEEMKALLTDMESWLKDRDIYYDRITSEKLGAIAYIDDRGVRFNGDWKETLKFIGTLEASE